MSTDPSSNDGIQAAESPREAGGAVAKITTEPVEAKAEPATATVEPARDVTGAKRASFQGFTKDAMELLIGILLPTIFGLFAVISVQYAGVANDQSQMANQLALLSLCAANIVSYPCSSVCSRPPPPAI